MNDEDDELPQNVIRIDFGSAHPTTKVVSEGLALPCKHLAVTVDPDARTVECSVCGAAVDAFDVLLEYANKERRYRHWERETNRAVKRLDELKDEERRVKARTKSHSRKDAARAVAEAKASVFEQLGDAYDAANEAARLAVRARNLIAGKRRDMAGTIERCAHGYPLGRRCYQCTSQ